jgi:chemotaxis protein methyltransferase CheR
LRQAASAVYGRRSFRGAEAGALHFESAGADLLRVAAPARDMVSFTEHNLACPDWPLYLQGMDIILCRNVLMYFSPRQARLCIARMRDCLVEGGWLVVSPSEATPELFAGFEVERHPDAIWFRKCSRPVSVAAMPPARSMPSVMRGVMRGVMPGAQRRQAAPRPSASPVSSPAASPGAEDCDRDRAQDYCSQALTAAEAGHEAEAAEHLRRALYLDPDCILATWLLGMLLERQGRTHAARLQFDAAARHLEGLPVEALVPGTDGMRADALRQDLRALLARREAHKLVA